MNRNCYTHLLVFFGQNPLALLATNVLRNARNLPIRRHTICYPRDVCDCPAGTKSRMPIFLHILEYDGCHWTHPISTDTLVRANELTIGNLLPGRGIGGSCLVNSIHRALQILARTAIVGERGEIVGFSESAVSHEGPASQVPADINFFAPSF